MTLTNYWWLIIWIIGGGVLLLMFRVKRTETVMGREEERWKWLPAILLMLPFIIWAGFRDKVGDTGYYRLVYQNMPTQISAWGSFLRTVNKDWGFSVLSLAIKAVFRENSIAYFLIIAVFQGFALIHVFRKHSSDYWFSIFLFVASTDYISWMMNGMRQFTAVALIFAFTDWLVEKKNIRMIGIILLASTLHASALIMIPIMFIIQRKAWNFLTFVTIGATVATLFFVDRLTGVFRNVLSDTQYSNIVNEWEEWGDNGTNPIRVLVYSIPVIIAIFGNRYIKEKDNPMVNLCVNAGVISTSIYVISMVTSGIFIGRLPIYVSMYATCILLPWEIDHIFTERSAKIIKAIAVVAYIGFFYYQMHIAWHML